MKALSFSRSDKFEVVLAEIRRMISPMR